MRCVHLVACIPMCEHIYYYVPKIVHYDQILANYKLNPTVSDYRGSTISFIALLGLKPVEGSGTTGPTFPQHTSAGWSDRLHPG